MKNPGFIILAAICCVILGNMPCFAQCDGNPGQALTCVRGSYVTEVCAGTPVGFSVTASDPWDMCGDPHQCPGGPITCRWTVTDYGTFDGGPSQNFTWTTPGIKSVSCKTVDTTTCSYRRDTDKPVTPSFPNVTVVGISGYVGPGVRCINEVGTFTATSDPTGHENMFTWSAPGGSPASGQGGEFITSWSEPGIKTVTVNCCNSSASLNVTVVRLASVSIDQEPQAVLWDVTLTAETDPPGYASAIGVNWSGGDHPESHVGATFTTKYDIAGDKTITATACNQSIQTPVRIIGGPFKTTTMPSPTLGSHLRYFCNTLAPPPNDQRTVRVRDSQPSNTWYEWTIYGSSSIQIEADSSCPDGSCKTVKPIGGSSSVKDCYVLLTYHLGDFYCSDTNTIEYLKDPEGEGLQYCRFYTVFQPLNLEYYGREDNIGDLGNGFESVIYYMIVSSVQCDNGCYYMASAPHHEEFPSLPETNYIENNWAVGTAGSGSGTYFFIGDNIIVTGTGNPPFDPAPESPSPPPKEYNLVDYWVQLWYIGSTSAGNNGCMLQDNILMRYLDHGTHDLVPDPQIDEPVINPPPSPRYTMEWPND